MAIYSKPQSGAEYVKNLVKQVNAAFGSTERRNAETQWNLISKFVLPGQFNSFTSTGENNNKGGKVTEEVTDSTAIRANQDLSAAIHSTLTSSATQWIKFQPKNIQSEGMEGEVDESVEWLEDVEDRIHSALNDSNFNDAMPKGYQSGTSIGNGALLMEEAEKNFDGSFGGFEFTALHMGELAWSENSKGRVDTAYRRLKITARQAAERFGEDKISEKVKQDLEEYPDREHQYFHIICPRPTKKVKLVNGIGKPTELPFASIYIDPQDDKIVEEGGYYEFPIMAIRWETAPGEVYARGPGHIAYPDIRTLNLTKELYLDAFAKAVKPPLTALERYMSSDINRTAGAITYVTDHDAIREMPSQARFDVTLNGVEELKQSIQQCFFLDKIMLPPRETHGEMTAYETHQRVEQMQRVLGPTIGRLDHDVLKPIAVRAFGMMLRAGALAPMPEAFRTGGIDVNIEFVNQLSRAQKAQDITAYQHWVQILGTLAQLGKPEGLDYIDSDLSPPGIGRTLGVPESYIANNAKVKAIRDQRAQIQQQQLQLDSQMKAADIQSKQAATNPQGGGQQ